jgi:Tol biopolymer transport system component
MKKLLMGSIALTMFSISMIVFQLSCKKEANAQTTTTGVSQLNILLFQKTNKNVTPFADELWTSNYDGTNQKQIPIPFATGQSIREGETRLSPDGKLVFMTIRQTTIVGGVTSYDSYIYSCNIDGSNYKKVVGFSSNVYAGINGVY